MKKVSETVGIWGIISHEKRWLTWGGSLDRAKDFMLDIQTDSRYDGYNLSLIYFESVEAFNNHKYNKQ